MLNYFDKDFLKFLFGFLSIIAVSLVIIFSIRTFLSEREINDAPIMNVANP